MAVQARLKSWLIYLLPLVLVFPSFVWIASDNSVWPWDQALYGKGAVELFYTLTHSPRHWILQMAKMPQAQAPGISWVGQFFVPLGIWLGSIDMGLLVSIVATQALTLLLLHRAFRKFSGDNEIIAVAGCLVVGSAPLFVGLSHHYLTEPLQLFAVSWFVLIMSFAPQWRRSFIVSHLLAATPVAMLAKASSLLYCAGPGLVVLWYVYRPVAFAPKKTIGSRIMLVLLLVAGLLLNIMAIRWYSRNIAGVMQHVAVASSGPIAEIYGKTDNFTNTIAYWAGSLRTHLFQPTVFVLASVVVVAAVIFWFIGIRRAGRHFSASALIALIQIGAVLVVFSFSPNREARYLLPLLPYVALLLCWSLAQTGSRIVTGLLAAVFLAQLAITQGRALGILAHASATPQWLIAPNNVNPNRESIALDAIVAKTCSDMRPQPYFNLIGIEKPWLNEHSANYLAAKRRVLGKPVHCRYGSFGYESDSEKIWQGILANVRYYIAIDPDANPVPAEDAHLRAINSNYLPVLDRVRNSQAFELELPLAEDPTVWIFRRVSTTKGG